MKALIIVSVLLALTWWGGAKLIQQYNHWRYSKPWFNGTQAQLVCKMPYYSNADCYTLSVSSDGQAVQTIYFPNGGYRQATSSECVQAATGAYNFKQFCSLYTSNGERWDVMPLGSVVD